MLINLFNKKKKEWSFNWTLVPIHVHVNLVPRSPTVRRRGDLTFRHSRTDDWDRGTRLCTCILFVYGLAFRPHVSGENDDWKHNFSKTLHTQSGNFLKRRFRNGTSRKRRGWIHRAIRRFRKVPFLVTFFIWYTTGRQAKLEIPFAFSHGYVWTGKYDSTVSLNK